jgi:hypothetical protein
MCGGGWGSAVVEKVVARQVEVNRHPLLMVLEQLAVVLWIFVSGVAAVLYYQAISLMVPFTLLLSSSLDSFFLLLVFLINAWSDRLLKMVGLS